MSFIHLPPEDAQFHLDHGFASLADACWYAEVFNRSGAPARCTVRIERRRPFPGLPSLATPVLVFTEIADY
jgi:hypothetical protein